MTAPAAPSDLAAQLIDLAHTVGADPNYVRAGGGNCSYKADGVLHIKPSGLSLAAIEAADLVPLRLDVLLEALRHDTPGEPAEPDAPDADPVRAAAERARIGRPARRPSVELLFHALLPEPLVLHAHPLACNALTCNEEAEALAARLFGDAAVYVPYTDPGVPLARAIERRRADYEARTGRPAPGVTFLGNHGLIVAGQTADEVRGLAEHVTAVINRAIAATPEPTAPVSPLAADPAAVVAAIAPTLRGLLGSADRLPIVTSDTSEFLRAVTLTRAGAAIMLGGPLIPDQIVYAGSFPAIVGPPAGDDWAVAATDAVATYRALYGRDPIVTLVPGIAAFAAGRDLAAAETALATFTDALRVARDAERLGAVRLLDEGQRGFIETWEAESYRRQVAGQGAGPGTGPGAGPAAETAPGRLPGKVVVITGAAQGFGLGLAEEIAAQGATVVLADLNLPLARENAERLAAQHGPGRALAVPVDVSDPDSQLAAIAAVVQRLGGLDVFISNAGVLRAASVFDQPVADFDLVTNVNYRGYFLGVRAVAPVMALQHKANPAAWFDIIEINSKSGLEGSKRNFAYAGSKFGGIGLTQSFALELVEAGIKVNAICPGNYLDGPLWTDPECGLFVQYLRTGKVPGARTVDDVRRFYEAKVPLGRGCLPSDLAKAVYYIVEQAYETGQALPVTGGQNMLN
ncbi:MAG: SDR family NAD(P)-dependent oxidoreductase [Propionibacteriaceae bacterium]|jgi:rhamnose utilization protein RhaD (predicted bifunctional aldolase and dehydrogenase)/NAD(P)-dependent dehydrogenase (short-subunit alcohol dehydrogenase family)|nr:SDR family NAD(P)-dependent oxidoreductase [Propionibacteriaceae bacterium]